MMQCLRCWMHLKMHSMSLLMRATADAVLMHLLVAAMSLLMHTFTGAVSLLTHAFTDAFAVFVDACIR